MRPAVLARVGPFTFLLWRAARVLLPPLETRDLGTVDGLPLRAAAEGGRSFLLVDHGCESARPAYVELWRPVQPTEGAIALFVLAPAARKELPPELRPRSLTELWLELSRAATARPASRRA